jgi:hypothetical protein
MYTLVYMHISMSPSYPTYVSWMLMFVFTMVDVRGQIGAMRLARALVRRLHRCLDDTVSDAQERLVYCGELVLRYKRAMPAFICA